MNNTIKKSVNKSLYLKDKNFIVEITYDINNLNSVSIVDGSKLNESDALIDYAGLNGLDNKEPQYVKTIAQKILEHLGGDYKCFDFEYLDVLNWTDFKLKVFKCLLQTQAGQVVTYKDLACQAGYPYAYRAVGSLMSSNRFALVIPCHRVIKTSGNLGNYSGFGDVSTKIKLLDIEGWTKS